MKKNTIKLQIIVSTMLVMVFLSNGKALATDKDQIQPQNNGQAVSQAETKPDMLTLNGKTEHTSSAQLLTATLKALLIVIVFGTAAVFIVKKISNTNAYRGGKNIKVIETIHLGQRRHLHLLQVEDQKLLIASTPETITKLLNLSRGDYTFAEQDVIE